MRTSKTRTGVLWEATRDTLLYGGVFLAIACYKRIQRGLPIAIPTARTIEVAFGVFGVTWVATLVACAMGATTITDNLGGPPSGLKKRVPGTMAVAGIIGFLTFIVLLVTGFVP